MALTQGRYLSTTSPALLAWKVIWEVYNKDANSWSLFLATIKATSSVEKFFISSLIVLFSASSYVYLLSPKPDLFAFCMLSFAAILLLLTFSEVKSRTFNSHKTFANEYTHRTERYALFNKALNIELRKNFLNRKKVIGALDFIDAQIEHESFRSPSTRAVLKFSAPVISGFIGVLALQLKAIDIYALSIFVMSALIGIMFAMTITQMYRTKEEKLRELKLFIRMYELEN